MRKFSFLDKIKFLEGRVSNLINNNQLLAISFEVTLSCPCNCQHCDLGGIRENEKQMKPEEFGEIVSNLKPLIIQLSGGEPLLRKDILEIVKEIKRNGNLPYTILVTNGVLLTEEKYLKLREAGVNQFSISLDFPDKRHDDFRRYPGLFSHLNKLIPTLSKYNFQDIILNSCITKANFKEVVALAKKAIDWGVKISYSAYTPLRTGNKDLAFKKEDLKSLDQVFRKLIEFKKKTDCIVNSETVLSKFFEFLKKGYMSNCQAGFKFVVVMPDGYFVPCSMKRKRFSSLEELRENFSKTNSCEGCYVSIRCYSERFIWDEIKDLPYYLRLI